MQHQCSIPLLCSIHSGQVTARLPHSEIHGIAIANMLAQAMHSFMQGNGTNGNKSFLLFVGLRLDLGKITGSVSQRAAPPHTLHCPSLFWNLTAASGEMLEFLFPTTNATMAHHLGFRISGFSSELINGILPSVERIFPLLRTQNV